MVSNELKSIYHRIKWALVIRGLLSIAVGVLVIARPLESVAAFALVIAIWAIFDGIVNMVHAFDLKGITNYWWVLLLAGIVSTGFGFAAVYYYPALSLAFIVAWTGLWLITAGVLGVYAAIQERGAGLSWGWTLVWGILAIAGGIAAFVYPGITLAGVMGVIAGFGIVGGIAMLVGAGKMQSVEHEVKTAFAGAART